MLGFFMPEILSIKVGSANFLEYRSKNIKHTEMIAPHGRYQARSAGLPRAPQARQN